MPTNQAPGLFQTDNKRAIDALTHAQFIAFAPYVFQISVLLRDKGILKQLEDSGTKGVSISEIAVKASLSHYAIRVLLEAALGIELAHRKDGKYFLSKTGHYFLNDEMTRVNTNWTRDVCLNTLEDMDASLAEGRPAGLHHLGPWSTIYEGLSILPEPAKTSWFEFDHFYSDNAFPAAMPLVFASNPAKVMDIGSNTGKFAMACLRYNPDVHLGLVDLQIQLDVAEKNLIAAGFEGRFTTYPVDMLDAQTSLPKGYDIVWMSQFLSCFSDDEIGSIARKCYAALGVEGKMFINETFWDRQKFAASAFALQMTSLYFTTMANGNSQMYDSEVLLKIITENGFSVKAQNENVGLSHTIVELNKH